MRQPLTEVRISLEIKDSLAEEEWGCAACPDGRAPVSWRGGISRMHFHLLKPVHGWRQFAGEVAIVVLGVLLALGAQQIVESLQQNQKRTAARQAIRDELSENLDAVRRREENQPCVDRRLDELERLIVATPRNGKLPDPLWVGRPQTWLAGDSRFEAETSGATTSLLSTNEQANYARIYSLFQAFEDNQVLEQEAWARLRGLRLLAVLDDRSRADAVSSLMQARYASFRVKVAMGQIRDIANELSLKEVRAPWREGSRSVCIPMSTPFDAAMKEATKGREAYGEP